MPVTMNTEGVRQRVPPASAPLETESQKNMAEHAHPLGAPKHGTWKQALRMFLFAVYFNGGCIAFVYPLLTVPRIGR